MSSPRSEMHFIVLPGGGYGADTENEAEQIVDWLRDLNIPASVLRYPLNTHHPVPIDAVRPRSVGSARSGWRGWG